MQIYPKFLYIYAVITFIKFFLQDSMKKQSEELMEKDKQQIVLEKNIDELKMFMDNKIKFSNPKFNNE